MVIFFRRAHHSHRQPGEDLMVRPLWQPRPVQPFSRFALTVQPAPYFSRLAAHISAAFLTAYQPVDHHPQHISPCPMHPPPAIAAAGQVKSSRRLMREMIFATPSGLTRFFSTLLDAADIQGHGRSLVEGSEADRIQLPRPDQDGTGPWTAGWPGKVSPARIGLLLPNHPPLGSSLALSAQGRASAMLNYSGRGRHAEGSHHGGAGEPSSPPGLCRAGEGWVTSSQGCQAMHH